MTGLSHSLPTDGLQNEFIHLEYLARAGPRIVWLSWNGSTENLLAETPDVAWDTPHGVYHLRGGHRLCAAPESHQLTYIPDDEGLLVHKAGLCVTLTGAVEGPTGLQKSIQVVLFPDRPAVELTHTLNNCGTKAVEVAPWAITQLRSGGIAVLPQPPVVIDGAEPTPNRKLVFWPYSSYKDPRLELDDDLVFIHGTPRLPPFKLGYSDQAGWAGYIAGQTLFVKRFSRPSDGSYPDMGCNVEVYVNDRHVELETLGPQVILEPGGSTQHVESWELVSLSEAALSSQTARQALRAMSTDYENG